MNDIKALIADDDESISWVLESFLNEKGISALKAGDGVEASRLLNTPGIRLAIIDINMPGKDGLQLLKEVKLAGLPMAVIIMTAEATLENTLEAMKLGAFDYMTKPFDLAELDIIVGRALENLSLMQKFASLSERLKERLKTETAFVGKSKAIVNVFKTAGKVAPKDVTVLILGESGTGKELLARLIHSNSPRAIGPFVAVNSAAVPRELMESELFGFEKGAFTGAVEAKKGKFELAEGGTLFLDEVGDMTPELQARLLRVIQEREFYRVGGKDTVKVDVRLIAATNQDIERLVSEKKFREDLLFRLNSVTITLPPLSERKGDIALLAEHFLEKFSTEFDSGPRSLSDKALDALDSYHWPGNVRELENVIRRAVLLSPNIVINPEDLMLPQSRHRKESIEDLISTRLRPLIEKTDHKLRQDLYDLIMPFMERPLLRLVLEKTKGNQVQAAELLGINRNTLRSRIQKLNIKMPKA